MKDKLFGIIEALVLIALGIIIIVCGAGTALDIYFGIICLIGGLGLVALAILALSKTKVLPLATIVLGSVLTAVGIALFTPYLSFAALINLFVIIILGFGAALVIYGVYTLLVVKNLFYGVGQIVIGAGAIVLAVLYMTVPDFAQAFWIVVGVLFIVYGALCLIAAFLGKKEK